ncbi:hypothetical protein ACFVS2_25190 [Brevibacillus sp. NPDC058079]|uniref:hypothetical protein n=1 Tax=Brevibacillus sp. NPDC058079 TaxID=3346330 RepID=UPI0036E82334
MDFQGYARMAATSIIHNNELHIKVPGFYGWVYDLVMDEKLVMPYQEDAKKHFESFPFIYLEGTEVVKGKKQMTFIFDMPKFHKSNELKVYSKEYVKDMNQHAKKIEKDAERKRQKALEVEKMYLSEDVLV